MSEVYEYRRAPSKAVIWLAIASIIVLLTAVVRYGADHLIWLLCVFGAATAVWIFMRRPAAGIRIDTDYLVLSAWRNPRPIALDDIAHLRVREGGIETEVTIVYRNGNEEAVFSGDLPDIDTLIPVMAERGIPVRDVS